MEFYAVHYFNRGPELVSWNAFKDICSALEHIDRLMSHQQWSYDTCVPPGSQSWVRQFERITLERVTI